MDRDQIADLEVLIGHVFRDRDFLWNALSHSSVKTQGRPSNERLEFLGDSVLGMLISESLYRRYPDDDEGTLTRIKSQAVSRATLQRVAVAMGLDRFILVGKGVAKREIPASLLGNLYEAIVGAIYLDAGLAAARKFIMRQLDVVIEEIVDDRAERNYKSMLQHHCQKELGQVPVYRVLREFGAAHDRQFEVSVQIGNVEHGRARAPSKKEAEQGAARAAMIHFRAVDETERTPVRGAGTLVQVGPPQARGQRDRDEGGRRGRGRRGRRGGRRHRGDGPNGEERPSGATAAAPEPAAEAPAPDRGKPARAEEPAPAASKKKRSRRKSTRKSAPVSASAGGSAPGGGGEAAEAGGGDAKPKKATRRRKSRSKKKTGKKADDTQAGGSQAEGAA